MHTTGLQKLTPEGIEPPIFGSGIRRVTIAPRSRCDRTASVAQWIEHQTSNLGVAQSPVPPEVSFVGFESQWALPARVQISSVSFFEANKNGVMRESNSRPLAPEARIIPLDQSPIHANKKFPCRDLNPGLVGENHIS